MSKNSVSAITLTTFASIAMMPAVFQVVNANGLDSHCSILVITNDSTQAIYISYDGVNEHDYIAANGKRELFLQANSGPGNYVTNMSKGVKVYVKGIAGVGLIAVSGYYQKGI